MKKLKFGAIIPVMDIILSFGEDEIEVNVVNDNPDGQPTIMVYEVGGKDVDEETRKEYTDFVLEKIKAGEFKLPDNIELNPLSGEIRFNECISINQ